MSKTLCVVLVQLVCFFLLVKGIPAEETKANAAPEFFKVTADAVTKILKNQLMSSLTNQNRTKRQTEEGEESAREPELHFSTLRAQASGSGFPSPTMFVGGFSFMMMPTPEGSEIMNMIKEAGPQLMNLVPKGK